MYPWIFMTSPKYSKAMEKGRDPTPSELLCTSILMVMMENLLLVSILESFMKNMKRYYRKKQYLNMKLINVKHITKLWEEKRREEYIVLDLKQKVTTGRIFVSHHQYHLQFLNQHQQQMWMSW